MRKIYISSHSAPEICYFVQLQKHLSMEGHPYHKFSTGQGFVFFPWIYVRHYRVCPSADFFYMNAFFLLGSFIKLGFCISHLKGNRWTICLFNLFRIVKYFSICKGIFHFSEITSICVGSLDTLEVRPKARGLDTRLELLKFYKENYSANLMHLVVYAKG